MVDVVREFLKAVGGGPKTSRALTREEAREAMGLIAGGQCAPEHVGALLMALGVPVLLRTEIASPWAKHGLAQSLPCPPESPEDAARSLGRDGLAVLDLPSYAPVLAQLVSLRALFGRRTVAQTLCKLIDPLS